MSEEVTIRHVIPQIGVQEITLYSPADQIYKFLTQQEEIKRLNNLLHLGVLTNVFPGHRQVRWDYTLAMLYYCKELSVASGLNSSFTINEVEFSSQISAIQTISLLWNIGHIPGTFSVEKGIYRYLHLSDESNLELLPWPASMISNERMMVFIGDYLDKYDYLGLARVLGILKMSLFAEQSTEEISNLFYNFAIPFFVNVNFGNSSQWSKLREGFGLVRHLAYLTLDSPFSGINWTPEVPVFFQNISELSENDLQEINSRVSEILSPIARIIYEAIYHAPEACRECAIFAENVYQRLVKVEQPQKEILNWLNESKISELDIQDEIRGDAINRIHTIRIRSHFIPRKHKPSSLDESLSQNGYPFSSSLKYSSWNSKILFEPDEMIIDVFTKQSINSNLIGRLILWVIKHFDLQDTDPHNFALVYQKTDIENIYTSLLSKAFRAKFNNFHIEIKPWELNKFGLFPEVVLPDNRGGIWASKARLDDKLIKHIVYKRTSKIREDLREEYAEILGIRALRKYLRNRWYQKELRQRWLVITSSIRICDLDRRLMEFDGGLMKISTRSGKLTFFGLETKSGSENPLSSLNNRLDDLDIDGNSEAISTKHAFVELPL